MNNENKDFFNNDVETNVSEEDIILAPPTELYDEAKEIAQNTTDDEKFPFILQYDANQKDHLQSMLQMVGAVVEDDDEEGHKLSARMNMTQLAFIKRLESVERVMTNEVHNPFLMEEAKQSATVAQTTVEAETTQAAEEMQPAQVMTLAADETVEAVAEPAMANADDGIAVACAGGSSSSCNCPTNSNMQSAQTITVGSLVGGRICCPGAEQWFKFTVPQTKKYTIYTNTHPGSSLDTIGTLYDCSGNEIIEVDDYAPCGKINFRIIRTLTAGRTYYLKVRLFGNNIGSYTLKVTDRVLANYTTITPNTITLEKGVLYELPLTPNYTYKGYNGARPIPGLSVSMNPSNTSDQTIWWSSDYRGPLDCFSDWDDDGDQYFHLIARDVGTANLYAVDWVGHGKRDECTVTVVIPYCGGDNYRDVTQHSMVLQSDGYYVCRNCGYRVKSPALQDKDILSDEDYYTVLSCYASIPYYSKIDGEYEGIYSIKATALRLIIDDIRSKSQYAQKYEYVGNDGVYKREYTVGNENNDYYMPVNTNYNIIDNGLELVLNNGVVSGIVELIIGWKIPDQYQFLFFDLTDGYSNLTDFLCGLAEEVGYKEISFLLKLILFGASADDEMAITDKVVKIQFIEGASVVQSKTVFDANGNLKSQEHSVC